MILLLYIESDAGLQADLKKFLERNNEIRVESIASATDALDRIRTKKFDAIVSEYFLPVTDGQTFLEILRNVRNDFTPFIFFGKQPNNDIIIKALNAGATFYVHKGSDPHEKFPVLEHIIVQSVHQKQVEDALKESEKRYRSVVEDQSEFIIRFSPDGTLVFVNEAYCNYFHILRDEILGKNIFTLIPEDHRDKFSRHLHELTRENPVKTGDSRIVTDEGSIRWQRWNNRAIFDEEGHVVEFQCVGRDITEQKNTEISLVHAHRNLGIMNTITRHDVLNQLTSVFGFLELSLQSCKDPQGKDHIRKAIAAAETIRTQILFTKDYQDIGSTAPQWQNLESVIHRAVQSLDLSGVRVDYTLPEFWIFADLLIERAFYNLLENSLRHGTNVSQIQISTQEDGSGLLIVYADNGSGVPPDAKEKIFRREYFSNTGLGLYLIREILAMTHIEISETGTFGQGVRFEIRVPSGKYAKRIPENRS
jgi:PAS domain S-box-containing protein